MDGMKTDHEGEDHLEFKNRFHEAVSILCSIS